MATANCDTLRKIFIGSIPETVLESEIRAAVTRFGTIEAFHYNQSPRGWALATLQTQEEANAAVAGLHERVVFSACQGPIVCRIANDKKATGEKKTTTTTNANRNPYNVYGMYGASTGVRQHPAMAATAASLYGMALTGVPEQPPPQPTHWLTYYTPEGHAYYYNVVTKITQWEKPAEASRPAVAATMASMTQAQIMAYNQQQQQQRLMMMGGASGSNLISDPNIDPDVLGAKKFGPPGCNLFVFHIPSEWSHKDLYDHFRFFGKIVSSRVKTDAAMLEGSGRNLGFGFVSYESPEAALLAIKSLHGFNVGGKWLKVTLKKGEEHLLPPHLQAVYKKAVGKGDTLDQQYNPTNGAASTDCKDLTGTHSLTSESTQSSEINIGSNACEQNEQTMTGLAGGDI